MLLDLCFLNKNIEFVSMILKNRFLLEKFESEEVFFVIETDFLEEIINNIFTTINYEKVNINIIEKFLYLVVERNVTAENINFILDKTFFLEICFTLGLHSVLDALLTKFDLNSIPVVKMNVITDFYITLRYEQLDNEQLIELLSNKIKILNTIKLESNFNININYIKTKLLINFLNIAEKVDNPYFNDNFILKLMKNLFNDLQIKKNYDLINFLNNYKLKSSLDYYIIITESFSSYNLIESSPETFEFVLDNSLAQTFCSQSTYSLAMENIFKIKDSKTKKLFYSILKRKDKYFFQSLLALDFFVKISDSNYGFMQLILANKNNLALIYSFNLPYYSFDRLGLFISKLSLNKKKLFLDQMTNIIFTKSTCIKNITAMFEFIPSHKYNDLKKHLRPQDLWISLEQACIQVCDEMKHENFQLEQEKNFPELLNLNQLNWDIAESKHQLLLWGRILGHCIGTQLYAEYAKAGKIIILGYKERAKIKYTLEIKERKLVQVQGYSGLKPDLIELKSIETDLRASKIID